MLIFNFKLRFLCCYHYIEKQIFGSGPKVLCNKLSSKILQEQKLARRLTMRSINIDASVEKMFKHDERQRGLATKDISYSHVCLFDAIYRVFLV